MGKYPCDTQKKKTLPK